MLNRLVYIFLATGLTFFSCTEEKRGNSDQHLFEGSKSGSAKDSTKSLDFGFTTDLTDDIAAYKTVVNIIRETGLAQNFVILPGDVNNVKAYIEDNERILEYNPDFMEKLQGDTNWHGISVLARQIGHHLSQHDLEGGTASIDEEIEADKYAGFVLYKMGASLDDALKALESAISEDSLGRGISKNSRLVSLSKGWNDAKTLMTNDTVIVAEISKDTTSVKEVEVKVGEDVVEGPEFSYNVYLAIDKTMYFIDDENVVFQEIKGKMVAVGLKKDSDKPGFNWIFMKEGDSYGVDLKGRLWAYSTEGTGDWMIVGQAVKLAAK